MIVLEKKINSVETIASNLSLTNIDFICDRVENFSNKSFDVIVSRAVADMAKICEYALPLLKIGGYFIAYKSKKALEEIHNAKSVLKKYNAEIVDIIEYTLPLEEVYERNLVCVKKVK